MHMMAARSEKEMHDFKGEMRDFKDEMHEFKNEMRNFKKNIHKELGEIANRAGRLVEDIVAPGIPKIFRDITGLNEEQIEWNAVRFKKRQPAFREFDAVIAGGGYILINETKSVLRPEIIKAFHALMKDKIRDYFPDAGEQKFIGVVSSLYVDESIVSLCGNLGLYVLGFGDDLLDVLNAEGFTPQYF
jgi:hypothetical protein